MMTMIQQTEIERRTDRLLTEVRLMTPTDRAHALARRLAELELDQGEPPCNPYGDIDLLAVAVGS